jgi:hypothetical protein
MRIRDHTRWGDLSHSRRTPTHAGPIVQHGIAAPPRNASPHGIHRRDTRDDASLPYDSTLLDAHESPRFALCSRVAGRSALRVSHSA